MEMPKYLQKLLNRPLTAIVDTREQTPLEIKRFCPQMEVVRQKLPYGDYSLQYPNCVLTACIERKSLDDFVQSIIRSQTDPEDVFNNFKSELIAMRGYRYRMVVVEGTISDVCNGSYHSLVNPNSVLGFVSEWSCMHQIPILFADNHKAASYIVASMLWKIAMREIRENLTLGHLFPNITLDQLKLLGPINDNFLDDLSDAKAQSLSLSDQISEIASK